MGTTSRLATVLAGLSLIGLQGASVAAARTAASAAGQATLENAQYALSCPGRELCYSLAGAGGDEVVNTIKDGRLTEALRIKHAENLTGMSCPTAAYCLAVGTPKGAQKGLLVEISHGAVRKERLLSWTPDLVSCPRAGHCVTVGNPSLTSDGTLEAGLVSGDKVTATSRNTPSSAVTGGTITLSAFDCASTTACELAGETGGPWFVDSVGTHARLGRLHAVDLSAAGALSCHSGACVIGGGHPSGEASQPALYSLQIGGSHPKLISSWTASTPHFPSEVDSLSCITATECTAMGIWSSSSYAIVTFRSGKPGTPQDFAGSQQGTTIPNGVRDDVVMTSASTWSAIAPTGHNGLRTLFVRGTTSP